MQLTARQRQCLVLAATGEANKGIAEEIGLKYSTVRIHILSACRRLNASNRVEAVVRGIINGELSLEEIEGLMQERQNASERNKL